MRIQLLVPVWLIAAGFAFSQSRTQDEFSRSIRPTLVQHCAACHNPTNPKNNFPQAMTAKDMEANRGLWRSVAAQLRNRTMPPVASKLTEEDRIRVANCLSFTLLFLTLAREAGLEAQPQEIENTLSWRQEAGTIYRNNHINTRVRMSGRQLTVDTSGDTLITMDRPIVISRERLLAHYFNNLAMQELERQNPTGGLQLMDIALKLDADYAPLWSNAGVLHVRAGDLAAAERAYARALALDPHEDGALFNMIGLSKRLGDAKREENYRRRLARVQQRDPLHHFMLAMDAERNGIYRKAIAHYRQAIRLQPHEHRLYSALARVYLKDGNARRAGRALTRAQALSDGAVRAGYHAQLQELKKSSN